MRRADRLFQIIQVLRGRRLTTASYLADRLEVSIRTVYRDIRDLMLSGVPIEGEAGVGYILRRGYMVPPLMFTQGEIEALVIGARWVRSWAGPELTRAADDALVKIGSVLPDRMKEKLSAARVFAPGFNRHAAHRTTLETLRSAINDRRIVSFSYTRADGTLSRRDIRPLGLFFWGAVWTLAGWCELRKDFRSFRVDRIKDLSATQKVFTETAEISLDTMIGGYRSSS